MTRRFWIGTSGWHYRHWAGHFYSSELRPSQWLAYYVGHFSTVEINNSFYRQPSDGAWRLWRETAPAHFQFAVKASRFLTHIKRLHDCADPLDRFLSGARRLGDRLGPILYQLPPTFHHNAENLRRLESFLELLPASARHAFEFRHASWFVKETFDLLRRRGAAFCSFDMPGLECPLEATADFAYVRFHGADSRYGGNYPDEQLAGWAAGLRSLRRDVGAIYAYFNNDIHGFAVANARALTAMLAEGD